ncbi:ATP-binding protein, partial [Aurantimonas sp. VKM B-3413]|uniref:ATP-binding protein n=1 Tax=Aurantimonas sp. VKM B-3413 TaxID=2779401 RepID=UPI001E552A4E
MNSFSSFDPLKLSHSAISDETAAVRRQKRNIHSILHSYVGWYDPFAELIQNALDSVDKRATREASSFQKKVSIIINLQSNQLTVSDNGTGLDETAFHRFLAPNESFKDEDARGSKGVGATFIAYGFNFIRIDTKTKTFSASGIMENARDWLHDKNTSENPHVYPTTEEPFDENFGHYETGASVTIRFGPKTKPSVLSWPSLLTASAWHIALSIKTAIGAINSDPTMHVNITCIDSNGDKSFHEIDGISYIHPHLHLEKVKDYDEVIKKVRENVAKRGAGAKTPASISNLEAISINWNAENIIGHLTKLTDEQKDMIRSHNCTLSGSYIYTAEIWKRLALLWLIFERLGAFRIP